jgi:hypothetical protein
MKSFNQFDIGGPEKRKDKNDCIGGGAENGRGHHHLYMRAPALQEESGWTLLGPVSVVLGLEAYCFLLGCTKSGL